MVVRLAARLSTFCLCLALVVKASQCFAQDEDYGAYRHEFYREDDNRMSIDTDSASFDIGLKPLSSTGPRGSFLADHVRLTGSFVYDGISGATPLGPPPMKQWELPTFNTFLNQRFQAAINDPGNMILFTSGTIPTYSGYTNYIWQTNPQLPSQARNDVTNFNQSLSTNALYNSGKVPLTQLHDIRRAYSLGIPVTFDNQMFTPELSLSRESDYHSYGLAFNYQILLNQKNTTLDVGWSHNVDRVRDYTEVIWQGKVSDDIMIGINQLLTPKSYLTVNFIYGQEYGYLSDPYRFIIAQNNNLQIDPNADTPSGTFENRPRRRVEETFYTSYTHFIDPLNGSVVGGYRFYHDTYGIFAQTLDATWNQKLGKRVVLTPGFRYYYQTAAHFYAVIFPDLNNLPANYSSDYRLSRLQTFTASVSLTYRIQKHFSIDLTYMRYIMQGLDGVTSQSAYPSANVGSVGARVWF